ncbi:proprotein convertase subtilisin/kexin type 5-like [Entelurus aequoreus]|uniref:proprotein convertase subtilisin/kexin type 5-like n=1 Tax=Entelurus aequoreus TaxID=161455 RepID=UPI002B1CF5E0|nr:proprotein convertase subtilisin/kexin type 5-like [Entelurus aequoreus]
MVHWTGSLLCVLALSLGLACHARIYTNHWAVRIAGGTAVAERIAEKYGYRNMGQIGDLKDHYHFFHSRTIKRSTLSSRGRHSFISMEPKVMHQTLTPLLMPPEPYTASMHWLLFSSTRLINQSLLLTSLKCTQHSDE